MTAPKSIHLRGAQLTGKFARMPPVEAIGPSPPPAAEVPEADALAALLPKLDSLQWRLANLYQIVTKEEGDEGDGLVVPFKPNRAQRRLIARLHTRNVVCKARQLGITTMIAILWLDTALFSKSPIYCGVIAHERLAAEAIFRDKVLFAYEHLPAALRAMFPVASRNKTEISFAHNGATIRVATSVRSGTIHRLHVSEFGKIAAKYPAKAREVMTGSIPTVPASGILVIESTAEGQDGPFHDMTMRAKGLTEARAVLSSRDYRLHFYAWWEAPEYTLDDHSIVFTPTDLAYFAEVEAEIKRPLSDGQRAWYCATLRNDFHDERPLMWQEYPSTIEEAFKVSVEGCYYSAQLAACRKQGRIVAMLPRDTSRPCYTFWDLGRSDYTAVWVMQPNGVERRFLHYHEATGEELSYFAEWLLKLGLVFGGHYLPHEAAHKRQGITPDTNRSLAEGLEMLLPGHRVNVVPRVSAIASGIQSTRAAFASCWFDEGDTAEGLVRLGTYRKQWDDNRGGWRDEPLHNEASHGADAFRQFGQVVDAGEKFAGINYVMGRSAIAGGRGGAWGRKRRPGGKNPGMTA